MHPEVEKADVSVKTSYYVLNRTPQFNPDVRIERTFAFWVRCVMSVVLAVVLCVCAYVGWGVDPSASTFLSLSLWALSGAFLWLIDVGAVRAAIPRIMGRSDLTVAFIVFSSKTNEISMTYFTANRKPGKDGKTPTVGEILVRALPKVVEDNANREINFSRFQLSHVPSDAVGFDPEETTATFGMYEEGGEVVTIFGVCTSNIADLIRLLYLAGKTSESEVNRVG